MALPCPHNPKRFKQSACSHDGPLHRLPTATSNASAAVEDSTHCGGVICPASQTSAGNRLDWKCGDRTEEELWKQFDCDWEGALLRPGNMSLREAKDVYEVNKDLWVDSMEISQVCTGPPPHLPSRLIHLPCRTQYFESLAGISCCAHREILT